MYRMLLVLCIIWLGLFAPVVGQNTVPQWALSNQLNRQAFHLKLFETHMIDVYSESDLKLEHGQKNVVFNIQKDIYLSQPIQFVGSCNILVKGNGHSISPKYPTPTTYSNPMRASSWSYDTASGIVSVMLVDKSDWGVISEGDEVRVFYEAWFQRFSDKVISTKGNVVTFRCTHEKMKNPKYMKLTPAPVVFFGKRNPSTKASKSLESLIQVDKGASVELCHLEMRGIDAKSCVNNKGVVKITNCRVKDCENDGIVSAGRLFVDGCVFKNITNYAITTSQNTYLDVQNCEFRNIGMRGSNSACVHSRGNAYIGHNKFVDFNYCAISLGYINVSVESYLPSAIAEYNEIRWTRVWEKKMEWYGLCDGGAIYVATNNKRCILRYNTILNFGGRDSNRGIYLDDGAYNVSVYSNVIKGVRNSYDIDSRNCSKNPQRQRPVGYDVNTNNYIGYNICSGKLNMHGSSAKKPNNCCFENNVIVGVSDSNESVVKNNILDKKAILYDRKAKITRLGKVRLKETKSVVGL